MAFRFRVGCLHALIEGCPAQGIAALDWRKEHDLPPEPSNQVYLDGIDVTDEGAVRALVAAHPTAETKDGDAIIPLYGKDQVTRLVINHELWSPTLPAEMVQRLLKHEHSAWVWLAGVYLRDLAAAEAEKAAAEKREAEAKAAKERALAEAKAIMAPTLTKLEAGLEEAMNRLAKVSDFLARLVEAAPEQTRQIAIALAGHNTAKAANAILDGIYDASSEHLELPKVEEPGSANPENPE